MTSEKQAVPQSAQFAGRLNPQNTLLQDSNALFPFCCKCVLQKSQQLPSQVHRLCPIPVYGVNQIFKILTMKMIMRRWKWRKSSCLVRVPDIPFNQQRRSRPTHLPHLPPYLLHLNLPHLPHLTSPPPPLPTSSSKTLTLDSQSPVCL